MSVIQASSVVVKTTMARLKADDIKKLVAADLGVDPKNVSLKFDFSYEYGGYRDDSITGATFSALEIKVTE